MENYKIIEDKKIKEKIGKNDDLFAIRDFYAYYYFFIDNEFYMVKCDDYYSSMFPQLTFYRITLEQFKKALEKYKLDYNDAKDYEFRLFKIEKLLNSINEEEIVKIEKEEKIKDVNEKIEKEINELLKLKEEAKKLGISDESFETMAKEKAKKKVNE